MTKRAILLGSILSLAIGLILPVTEFLIQGTRLGLSSATPAAFFLLFVILIGPQFLVKCLKRNWALGRGELMIIFGMMMVATVIPTRGFGGPFFSMITGSTYYASEENEWAKFIQPHLSETIVLKDSNAARLMYEGLEGAPIPWGAWIKPLGWWSFFMLCMAAMVISAMYLLRRTWIERERLVFPIAQVAMAMVEDDPVGAHLSPRPFSRLNPLFRSGAAEVSGEGAGPGERRRVSAGAPRVSAGRPAAEGGFSGVPGDASHEAGCRADGARDAGVRPLGRT